MRTLNQIREQHRDLLLHLSLHGWDLIGTPRQRGITTFLSFYHGGTQDEMELAKGELPYWPAQLDKGRTRREALRKKQAEQAGRTMRRRACTRAS